MTPDVNVLVAASRKDHPHHEVAAAWVKSAVISKRLVLLPMVAIGFVRIVTNARIFQTPTPTKAALAFINTILDATETQMLSLGSEWPQFCFLVESAVLTAHAIPDAWIAAAAREHNQHLVTFDKGFKKLLPRSQVTVLALKLGLN
jgi:uncharacterized protein